MNATTLLVFLLLNFPSFGARKDQRSVSINENKAKMAMKYDEKIPRAMTWCSSNMGA